MSCTKSYWIYLSSLVTEVSVSDRRIDIWCHSRLEAGICPSCLQQTWVVHQYQERQVQDLLISSRRVYWHLESRQWVCEACGRHFYERYNFLEPQSRMTQRYEKYLYRRCIGVDLQYVAVQYDHSWSRSDKVDLIRLWNYQTKMQYHIKSHVQKLLVRKARYLLLFLAKITFPDFYWFDYEKYLLTLYLSITDNRLIFF